MKLKTHSAIWQVFEKIDDVDKIAQCLLCHKEFSFRTTITNLKAHLRQQHTDAYMRLVEQQNLTRSSYEEVRMSNILRRSQNIYRPTKDARRLSKILRKSKNKGQKNPLWKYFQRESKETASCKLCQKNLSHKTTISNLRAHLRHKHQALFEEYIQELTDLGTSPREPTESADMDSAEAEEPVANASSPEQGWDQAVEQVVEEGN